MYTYLIINVCLSMYASSSSASSWASDSSILPSACHALRQLKEVILLRGGPPECSEGGPNGPPLGPRGPGPNGPHGPTLHEKKLGTPSCLFPSIIPMRK